MASTPRQRVQAGVVDTRVIGKPDQFDGDPMKYADWSFKLRSSKVSRGVDGDRVIVDTKTQRKPRERGKRTQHADVLHPGDDNFRSRVGQVSQCRRERRVRGLETVRDGMGAQTSDEVCGTPDERAGVQIPRRHSNKAGSIRENHTRLREQVHKDRSKIGVTMLGMEDMRVKEHLIRNSVRITSWNQMREEILEITRTQQYIDSQPMPMQLGANPKSKGKGKESKGKGKGKDIKGKDKAKDVRNELRGKVLLRCHDLGDEPQGPGDDDSLRGLGRKAFFWGQRERLLSRIRHTTRLVPFSANARGKLRAFLKADGRPLSWADSDDSEMLIDPTVGSIAGGQGASHPPTQLPGKLSGRAV